MFQAVKFDGDNDIKAEATLIELIDNNKKVLNTKINETTIEYFVTILKTNKNEKFINFLRSFLVCDGDAVLKNQNDMSRIMIKNEDVCKYLFYHEFRTTGSVIEVRVREYEHPEDGDKEAWVSISSFQELSGQLDQEEVYKYFLSTVHLLSDLCLDRNYVAIDYLESIYTFDLCFKVLSNSELNYELRSAFASLFQNLWICKKPYQPLILPRYLVLWDDLSKKSCEGIVSAAEDLTIFEDLIVFLKGYFEAQAELGCMKVYETSQNSFTLVLLEMTAKLVEYGFYKKIKDLQGLVKPLLVLLNGMKDAMTELQYKVFKRALKGDKKKKKSIISEEEMRSIASERYEKSEETLIVMKCKMKICRIIEVVNSINDDLNIRKFLVKFKKDLEVRKSTEANNPLTEK